MLPLGEICAIVLAVCVTFLLLCAISLLREEKAKACAQLSQARSIMRTSWISIIESAIEEESKKDYFISVYGSI